MCVRIIALVSVLLCGGCGVQEMIDGGAARMAIMAAGSVTGLAGTDEACGFTSLATMLTGIGGLEFGDDGSLEVRWNIEDCSVAAPEPVVQTDCAGDVRTTQGAATVSGSQVVALQPGLPPAPGDPRAVHLTVSEAELFQLVMTSERPSAPDEDATITFHKGRISAEIEPVLGESESAPGTYQVPTPVARISRVRLNDATLTIDAQGNQLDLRIDDSDLTATSGNFPGGVTNTITGYIVVDGRRVEIDDALESDYEPAAFDATYACTPDLAGPVR